MAEIMVAAQPAPFQAPKQALPKGAKAAAAPVGAAPCVGAPPQFGIELVDWCSASALQDAQDAQDAQGKTEEVWLFRRLAGFAPAQPPYLATFPDWFCAAFGDQPGYWAIILGTIIYLPLRLLDWAVYGLLPGLCNADATAALLVKSAQLGVAERWVGLDFGQTRVSLTQSLNFACPQTITDPGTAIQAYLHGTIKQDEARKWARANGWCDYTTTLAIDAAKWRPGPQDIVTWRNWGCLSNLTTPDQALQATGMIDQEYRTAYLCSSYTPLGVGEIYRLLHECRPGGAPGRPTYTQADATTDLKRLGYSDRDLPYVLYLARTPLGHRQLLQPYFQGDITQDQLKSYLLDDGYTSTDIDILLPYYNAGANAYTAKEAGIPDVKEVIKGLADGTLTSDTATSILALNGAPPSVLQLTGQVVQMTRQQDVRAAGIAAARAALKSGEKTPAEALAELTAFQVPADAAQLIIQEWQLEQSAKVKPAGAGELCTWYTQGLISTSDYATRLANMGYQSSDVARVMEVCEAKIRKAQEAAAAKKLAARQAAEAKSAAAATKATTAERKAQATAAAAKGRATQAQNRALLSQIRQTTSAAAAVASFVQTEEKQQAKGTLTPTPGPAPADVSTAPPAQ